MKPKRTEAIILDGLSQTTPYQHPPKLLPKPKPYRGVMPHSVVENSSEDLIHAPVRYYIDEIESI
ncbi:MAG TPA: hypothetical protein VK568_08150 [Thermodesulfobacteriota bacterium]|nr:hypothetical protein [Thermodesulfobacteriota bacterium]